MKGSALRKNSKPIRASRKLSCNPSPIRISSSALSNISTKASNISRKCENHSTTSFSSLTRRAATRAPHQSTKSVCASRTTHVRHFSSQSPFHPPQPSTPRKQVKNSRNRYKKFVSNPPRQILSGIQPTGVIHIGNLFGAVANWIHLQHSEPINAKKQVLQSILSEHQRVVDQYTKHDQTDPGSSHHLTPFRVPKYTPQPVLYTIVDLHALTIPKDPKELQRSTVELTATLLGAGIDPKKSTLFIQSHVHQHTELSWLLTCNTPVSWLYRMTQFKDKAAKIASTDSSPNTTDDLTKGMGEGEASLLHLPRGVSAGLLSYPLLMAADIILYNATHIPVGDDQRQHLEFTRDVVRLMNAQYGPTLVEPVPIHNAHSTRIMSLRTPTSKMSKSDPSPQGKITLTDSNKDIKSKIARAVTDSIGGVTYSDERPGLKNLLEIYAASENMRLMQEHHRSVEMSLSKTWVEQNGIFSNHEKLHNFALSTLPRDIGSTMLQQSHINVPNTTMLPSMADQQFQASSSDAHRHIHEWLSAADSPLPSVTPHDLALQHNDAQLSVLKHIISDSLIQIIEPIRNNTDKLLQNHQYLSEVTNAGADTARGIAENTMSRVRQVMGLQHF